MSGLYNLIHGVNPATFLILPMLGKPPDDYPRFRDCSVTEDNNILVLTRVGGGKPSAKYLDQMCKVYPKLEEKFRAQFGESTAKPDEQ